MMQSEFLSRRQRQALANQRRAKLDRFMNGLSLFILGFLACFICFEVNEVIHNPSNNPSYSAFSRFDYDKCDYMVAAGNLSTAPIPSDREWNEITLTPGGNWCIATDLND